MSSVIKLKLLTTCSSSGLFPGAFGGWSAPVFMLLMSLFATINTDPGSKNGCLMGKLFTTLALQLSVGRFRNAEIERSLTNR